MLRGAVRQLGYALVYGVVGIAIGGLSLFVVHQLNRPALQAWHTEFLDTEFTAADADEVTTLKQYLALEDRLFEQLRHDIQDQPVRSDGAIGTDGRADAGKQGESSGSSLRALNRYVSGSWSDPTRSEPNWNRSFELPVEKPRGAVLMLHGMSDSPYSLRSLGQALHEQGMWVVGLRLPGHGTAPVELTRTRWQDFAAAVRLVAKDLRQRLGDDVPLTLVGYSNGAALAIEYSIAVLEGEDLPRPAGLLLFSPEVGVSPAAEFAWLNAWLGRVPGWEKLAWLDIQPEFDPYKYNSFPVNAGVQAYDLTESIRRRLAALNPGGGIADFPPMLAFQSVVDATVSAPALVELFVRELAAGPHELVLFDVNRDSKTRVFLRDDPIAEVESLLKQDLPFTFTLITNREDGSSDVVERRYPQGDGPSGKRGLAPRTLGLQWPPSVYSLSHVAIPFAPDDPIYGNTPPPGGDAMTIGMLEPRGERGILQVPVSQLMRLRYNPFYAYIEQRVLAAIACPSGGCKDTEDRAGATADTASGR